jgi:uncharacterized LabA/DUF88 family protein
MVFVDGENLVCSYQRIVENGRTPKKSVHHKKDVYVWEPGSIKIEGLYEIIRASFYTYTTGAQDSAVHDTSGEIKKLQFERHLGSRMPNALHPIVFWKRQNQRAGKGVDIQMTVDILLHASQDNFDILYLVSGDGDYKPVLQEASRKGKQVYVAALSHGLNEELKYVADVFVDLDNRYYENA